MIDYDGRLFRPVANSANGQVDDGTRFRYFQAGSIVWADYAGGAIGRGQLIATVDATGNLDARYQHVDAAGRLMTGRCRSRLTVLPDGRYRLDEDWQWTSGDGSAGRSVVEEVAA